MQVACPTCGAGNRLVAGDTNAGCAYCGARLVPSRTVVQQVLDAAALAARQAGMAQLRAQRAMTLSMRKASVNPAMIMLGSFGSLLCLSGGAMLLSALAEGNVRNASILTLLILVVSLPLFGYFYWRSRRRERWTSPLLDLANQFQGRYSTKLEDQVGWLNAHWPITYSDYYITGVGLRFGTLSADVAGYAVLVDAHPEKPYGHTRGTDGFQPRLNVLLAAYIPLEAQSLSRLPAPARAHYDALREMGFQVSFSTAGILAEGNKALIQHFAKKPDELHLLAQAFQSLTLLGSHLGPPTSPIS